MAVVNALGVSEGCWRIVPLETPRMLRRCAKCGAIRRFASSDKFRLNAQQRKIDVWLIYKCEECDSTWNCTILTRCPLGGMNAELYQQFLRNDHDLAWCYAFDVGLFCHLGVQFDATVPVRVERSTLDCLERSHTQWNIRLEMTYPCALRLDRLLADELQVSRSCLQRWFDGGVVQVWPAENNVLRKPVRNGQVIVLYLGAAQ